MHFKPPVLTEFHFAAHINDHFDDCIEIYPKFTRYIAKLWAGFADKRDMAFQAWIIQKIAGLQLCVSELECRIEKLKK